MQEARDASSAVSAQYFSYGETIGGNSYYFAKDALGSIREMVDASGNVVSEYAYTPYGQVVKLLEAVPADFQFNGYYFNSRNGLNLTLNRAYSPSLGRFISRDPIGEAGGTNIYAYVW
jgi:RHS repeat-associated protein